MTPFVCIVIIFLVPCLERHNNRRRLHGANDLVWNPALFKSARDWARDLARRRTLENSPEASRTNIGENVFTFNRLFNNLNPTAICNRVINAWLVIYRVLYFYNIQLTTDLVR